MPGCGDTSTSRKHHARGTSLRERCMSMGASKEAHQARYHNTHEKRERPRRRRALGARARGLVELHGGNAGEGAEADEDDELLGALVGGARGEEQAEERHRDLHHAEDGGAKKLEPRLWNCMAAMQF